MDAAMAISDTVTCHCKCKTTLGSFGNSWKAIGKSYMSPLVTYHTDGLKLVGPVRPGAPNTIVGGSSLRDLACQECDSIVGLRCLDAPQGHDLSRHENILRLKLMSVISDRTGGQAVIPPPVKTIALLTQNASRGPSPRVKPLLSSSSDQHKSSQRHNKPVSSTLDGQQENIANLSGAIARVEGDMQSFKDFLLECRADLGSLRDLQEERNQDHLSFLSRLGKLESGKTNGSVLRSVDPSLSEFDRLAEDILEVNQKASEVEALKMEIRFLKTRLQRLEDSNEGNTPASRSHCVTGTPRADRGGRDVFRAQRGHSMVQLDTTSSRLPHSSDLVSSKTLDMSHDKSESWGSPDREEEATTGRRMNRRWRYTGPASIGALIDVFPKFGINYCKHGVKGGIDRLEKHVHKTAQWDTKFGRMYGALRSKEAKKTRKRKSSQHDFADANDKDEIMELRRSTVKRAKFSEHLEDREHLPSAQRAHVRFSSAGASPEIASSVNAVSPSPILGRYDDDGNVMPNIDDVDDIIEQGSGDARSLVRTIARQAMPPPPQPKTPAGSLGDITNGRSRSYSNPEKTSRTVTNEINSARRRSLRSQDLFDHSQNDASQLDIANAATKDDDTDQEAAVWIDPTNLKYQTGERRSGWYGPDGRLRTKDGYLWGVRKSSKPSGQRERTVDVEHPRAVGEASSLRTNGGVDAVLSSIEVSVIEEEEARRRMLNAREQLVRATLEREHYGVS